MANVNKGYYQLKKEYDQVLKLDGPLKRNRIKKLKLEIRGAIDFYDKNPMEYATSLSNKLRYMLTELNKYKL